MNGKNEIHKILVGDDWKKGPDYTMINAHPHVSTLFTERDKAVYKQKVIYPSFKTQIPETYLRQRRMMSPGFSIAYLNGLEPSMHECVQAFEEALNTICRHGGGFAIVDMSNMLSNLGSVSSLSS